MQTLCIETKKIATLKMKKPAPSSGSCFWNKRTSTTAEWSVGWRCFCYVAADAASSYGVSVSVLLSICWRMLLGPQTCAMIGDMVEVVVWWWSW